MDITMKSSIPKVLKKKTKKVFLPNLIIQYPFSNVYSPNIYMILMLTRNYKSVSQTELVSPKKIRSRLFCPFSGLILLDFGYWTIFELKKIL